MFAKINDCKIYYEVHGKEDGETIFFIHGGPGKSDCRSDIESFKPLREDYKLVFLDMRGSGRSDEKGPFSHEQWASDIDGLREFLEIDKIIIHGCSYGGFLSQEYAIRYPGNIKKVMLNVTSSNTTNNRLKSLAVENALKSNVPGITEELLNRLFDGEVQSNEDFKEIFRIILPLYSKVELDEKAKTEAVEAFWYHYETHNFAFSQNLPNFNVTHRLKEIKVPVLVTAGRHDWITPLVCSEEIVKEIEDVQFEIFENCGHSLIKDETERYVKLVKKFLQQ